MADLEYNDEKAFEAHQALIDAQVQQARASISSNPLTRSHCRFCHDPLPEGHGSFCDAGCRDLFERESHNRRVRGTR